MEAVRKLGIERSFVVTSAQGFYYEPCYPARYRGRCGRGAVAWGVQLSRQAARHSKRQCQRRPLLREELVQFLIEEFPGGVFFTYEDQGLEACPEQEVLDRALTGSGDSSLDPLEVEMLPVGGNDVAVRLERRQPKRTSQESSPSRSASKSERTVRIRCGRNRGSRRGRDRGSHGS